jgi:predicted HicB family RNase H-like nuclease
MFDKKYKKLCIRVPEELHAEIKMISAYKRMALQKWVLQAIAVKLLNDKRQMS